MQISVIIPTYNESAAIAGAVASLADADIREVIVADGVSTDSTGELAETEGAKVVYSEPGRAVQMNEGARAARGDALVFLHADTRLPEGFESVVRETLSGPGVMAGAFTLRIASPRVSLRVIEHLTAIRCRLFSLPYGDQAIFMRRVVFERHGGWPVMPIMEDYRFIRTLKRHGRVVVVPEAVTTSPRRWERLGVPLTTLINQAVILGYHLGISPARLKEWYALDEGL